MNTDKLTATEENALKWVLLCERLHLDPIATSVLDITGPAAVKLDETEHGSEYWIAGRDAKGCIRLNQGRGMHVADPEQGHAEVLAWFDMATELKWKRTYAAALALIAREGEEENIVRMFGLRNAGDRDG